MKCYKLFPEEHTCLGHTLSPEIDVSFDLMAPGKKNYYIDTEFEQDWRFTEKTRSELPELFVHIHPKDAPVFPDFWGSFSPVVFKDSNGGPVMISPAAQAMLNELISDKFETVPAGPIIDRTHGREITDHGHVYATFLEERDTYDREQTRIKPYTRGDGRTFLEVRSSLPTIDARAAKGGVIWREAANGELVVSDRFKDAFENIGGKGVRFHPLPMSHL